MHNFNCDITAAKYQIDSFIAAKIQCIVLYWIQQMYSVSMDAIIEAEQTKVAILSQPSSHLQELPLVCSVLIDISS